ncbi:hypothetical protein [Clavibacter michiganensis]|uniref:hypothetical protein n=1 Tax=Clavibacter michiganensis TaxID=28447 RepID=UPI0026DCDF1A|nr:hypothetical protein [Clavibacter michiganensis]MDO4039268.1 hypothetical protein [Clavibacter michiganensis]MDO4063905.1 hypothetical protein [Clavibacter michiganensis]MDO4110236.1 hypothetical protein [Clavibacter michiganensis]MDO4113414.1 hypothetical protein [Clavibacter michiganensis]MDO4116750.1 hypothetical protein [Clavibacter michiganensis]
MTYITYERPDHLHDRELDPYAPDADLSPTGETCGKTTNDVAGMEWTCTRRPHTDSEHRAAYEYRGDGPQGEVAIAWESNWGEDANRPRTTKTITTTITSPAGIKQYLTDDDVRSIERVAWESFDEDDHDELTITTAVAEGDAATTALAQFVDAFSADDLASAMSCIEADAIAAVLRTQGAAGAAYRWTRLHAAEDEPGDTHHSPAMVAPAEYVVPVDPMDALGCDSCQ